jgi:LysR family glycine cleavage system transcriptional activator
MQSTMELVYPIASESNPALVAFRDWLIEEVRRI